MPTSEPTTMPTTAPVERPSDCSSVVGGTGVTVDVDDGGGVVNALDGITICTTANKLTSCH